MKNASRSVAWARVFPLATLLLLSLLASAPIWGPGLLNTRGGGDSPFLLLRTQQMAVNLRAWVFPVRWMPDAAYGLGYPFYSYYASLPYYVAACFDLAGLGILASIKLTQTLFAAAATLTMYGWSRRLLQTRASAWVAAMAYTFAPFHLVNVYVRGDSLSEFAAFAFYPLILWGLDRLAAEPSLRRALFPGLAYAGLIITHNVSALIFSPFVLLYVAFYAMKAAVCEDRRPRGGIAPRLLVLIVPVMLGILFSTWFWLPALGETDDVQLTAQTTGYFHYANHFRGADLVQPSLLFDYANDDDSVSPFAMGLLQGLLTIGSALAATVMSVRNGRPSTGGEEGYGGDHAAGGRSQVPFLVVALFGLALSTWLITPLSRPLWKRMPLLQLVQFPWRFLSVQALFASSLIGVSISHVLGRRHWLAWAVALALAGAVVTSALGGLRPEFLPISDDDVTTERLQLYELFTGNIGSTIRHEYLPRWVLPRPYAGPGQISPDRPARAVAASGDLLHAERQKRNPTRRVWQVETGGEGAQVAFPVYYWPGWYAVVDGQRLHAAPVEGSGYLAVEVPPGEHMVELRLGRTPLRLAAEIVSLTSLVACAGLWLASRVREAEDRGLKGPRPGTSSSAPRSGRRAVFLAALPFLAALMALVVLHPRADAAGTDDLTMDFDTMPYLHHNPNGASVDGWRLTSYTYGGAHGALDESIAPGQTLEVILAWQVEGAARGNAPREDSQVLQLVPPGAVRNLHTRATAESAFDVAPSASHDELSGRAVVTLTVPQEAAPGIHFVRVGAASPIYLRPIRVGTSRRSEADPVAQTFAGGDLLLHDVKTSQAGADRLGVELEWSASGPVAVNYGLSLRLEDVEGHEWLRQGGSPGYDSQPGQGFLPTSLWPLRRVFSDYHLPALRPGAPPSDHYRLTVDLYDVPTWRSVGQYTTTVALTEISSPPGGPVRARFGGEIQLSELEVPPAVRQGEELALTAFWTTEETPSTDYTAMWELRGPGGVISSTQPLAPGSSPQTWPAGAWVAGRNDLRIPPTAPPGEYTLTLTVLESAGGRVVGEYVHPTAVEIAAQERTWTLPAMETVVGTAFGDMIELAGYDMREEEEYLQITLYWQALRTPDRHYTFFVHLADPETGVPASQIDAMPRGFTYPTGQWAPGEIVADEVLLHTGEVPSGEYVLAVGWYDPDTRQRLPVSDSEGRMLTNDRVLLPSRITIH